MADLRAAARHRGEPLRRRVMGQLRREIPTVLLTAPVTVPVWWGLWKVCDALWILK